MQLSTNTLLQGGKYRIERVLGQGGFGITYLATQKISIDGPIGKIETEIKLAIKEFFMKEYCNRSVQNSYVSVPSDGSKELVNRFRAKFIKESKTIAALKHPHIIRIYDVFEENGTAYYAMEYVGHGSLSELIKRNGLLEEADALRYIHQIADALEYIHQRKMNHLDVKPSNILLDDKMNAVLIDFGLSKRYNEEGNQTSSTPVGISHGYAPMEQYNAGGVGTFSPATDIYSLGATLYKLLTGITPPQANEVFNEGLPAIPSHLSASTVRAITEAMSPGRKERPQSVCEFLKLLDSETDITAEVEAEETVFVADGTVQSEDLSSSEKKPSLLKSSQSSSLLKKIVKRCGGFLSKMNSIIGSKEGNRKRRWTIVSVSLLILMVVSGFYIYRKYITPPVDYSTVAEAVDLGLSVNWASWNLGASSPDEYGAQLPWGETDTIAHDETVRKLNSDSDGDISGSICDVAREKWKGNWRTPTSREFDELKDKCTWKPEIFNGVSGYRIVGPNGNSIFLPDDWVYSHFFITDKLKYWADGAMGRTFKYWTSWEVSETAAWSHDECHVNKKEKLYIRPVSDNIERQKKDSVIAEMAKTAISANADKAYIDLGLSVLWITRNLGASNVENYGDYYSWGETKVKTIYNDSTYSGTLQWKDNIVETEYDVAYMNNSDESRLPTKEEFQELQEKCTWVWGEYKGVNGMIGIGPNGNAIFFPAAGYFYDDAKEGVGTMGRYISGTGSSSGIDKFYFSFSKYGADCGWTSGSSGRSVRPVRSIAPSEGNAVDLGLSVKWADRNVGAFSPAGYGDCFAWGETNPKKKYYNFNSVTYGRDIDEIGGNHHYDAARANWGGTWRLPTKADCQELRDKCTWTGMTQGGRKGYKVTGPNGNSIFLPAAGYCEGTSSYDRGSGCYYWSSNSSGSYEAYCLYSYSVSDREREEGLSVRPVSE